MFSLSPKNFPRYATTEKLVGETPLVAAERLREKLGIPKDVPLAYAGRLDPMASGKLLILIGDECKVQEKYHTFDKEYEVEILLGAHSDTGDILGLIESCGQIIADDKQVRDTLASFGGNIELPYPHFSSKTVQGKPLHVWTLEKRLNEIEIPTKKSRVHTLSLSGVTTIRKDEMLRIVRAKIETIPQVTDPKKALGEDFRREAVRASWDTFEKESGEVFQIISFKCIASSGTYMRSLSEKIAEKLGTCGLAYSIHRTKIGRFIPLGPNFGFWIRQF